MINVFVTCSHEFRIFFTKFLVLKQGRSKNVSNYLFRTKKIAATLKENLVFEKKNWKFVKACHEQVKCFIFLVKTFTL